MRRDENPLTGQEIAAPVWMLGGVKAGGHTVREFGFGRPEGATVGQASESARSASAIAPSTPERPPSAGGTIYVSGLSNMVGL